MAPVTLQGTRRGSDLYLQTSGEGELLQLEPEVAQKVGGLGSPPRTLFGHRTCQCHLRQGVQVQSSIVFSRFGANKPCIVKQRTALSLWQNWLRSFHSVFLVSVCICAFTLEGLVCTWWWSLVLQATWQLLACVVILYSIILWKHYMLPFLNA